MTFRGSVARGSKLGLCLFIFGAGCSGSSFETGSDAAGGTSAHGATANAGGSVTTAAGSSSSGNDSAGGAAPGGEGGSDTGTSGTATAGTTSGGVGTAGTSAGGTEAGGTNVGGSTAGSGTNGGSTSTGGGGTGNTGGTATGGSSAGGSGGGPDCTTLKNTYLADLAKARMCDANAVKVQCSIDSTLPSSCNCPVLVAAGTEATIRARAELKQFTDAGCSFAACGIACVAYSGAACLMNAGSTGYTCTGTLAATP